MARKNQTDSTEPDDGAETEQASDELAALRAENMALRKELSSLHLEGLKRAQVDSVLMEEVGQAGGLSPEHLKALAQLKSDCPEMPHPTAVEVVLRQAVTA